MHWPLPNQQVSTGYNPVDIVQGLTEYYRLLAHAAYFPPETIEFPPDDGWSDAQLDVDLLRTFGRSEDVITLLRHIPYVREGPAPAQEWQIWPETVAVRYLRGPHSAGWMADYGRAKWAPVMPMEDLPPHLVSLATGHYGSTAWIVDTHQGLIYGLSGHIEVPDHDEDKPWTAAPGYPIPYFFSMVKADIVSLTHIPSPVSNKSAAPEIVSYSGKVPRRLRRIYHAHNWPDLSAFNRDACIAAIVKLRQAEARGDLSDTTAQEDQGMELDDDDDDDDDDYEFEEMDPSGSEGESDDEMDLEDALQKTSLGPEAKTGMSEELSEELKFLRTQNRAGKNGHIERAAAHEIAGIDAV